MIRYATTDDLPRIAEILVFGKRCTYRPIFKNDKESFNDIQVVRTYQEFMSKPELIQNMLVYDDGIIKGTISRKLTETLASSNENLSAPISVELTSFYVDPFFRGQGIGKALISAFESEARKIDAESIFLWVLSENHSARNFYEKNGYFPDGQTDVIPGTNVTDMRYCKKIR